MFIYVVLHLFTLVNVCVLFFFFKQKTAYEMRISDWSSDVCSSDLLAFIEVQLGLSIGTIKATVLIETLPAVFQMHEILHALRGRAVGLNCGRWDYIFSYLKTFRSEEHTSELQSLMRSSYAVFCLKKQNTITIMTKK